MPFFKRWIFTAQALLWQLSRQLEWWHPWRWIAYLILAGFAISDAIFLFTASEFRRSLTNKSDPRFQKDILSELKAYTRPSPNPLRTRRER